MLYGVKTYVQLKQEIMHEMINTKFIFQVLTYGKWRKIGLGGI